MLYICTNADNFRNSRKFGLYIFELCGLQCIIYTIGRFLNAWLNVCVSRAKGKLQFNFCVCMWPETTPITSWCKMSGESAVTTLCLNLESVVCGHHVYKHVWRPAIGEQLKLIQEECNEHDPRAVAIVKDEHVVGHMPRCIVKTVWFFLRYVQNNRTKKERKWIGSTLYLYSLSGPDKLVRKLESVLDERQRSLP